MLIDAFQRRITYLRISVTDRCNYRCMYCMPPGGIVWQPHVELLTYEEITEVARRLAESGIQSIRLTGGEPLVRKGLPTLVQMLAQIQGIRDLSLTTNGTLLVRYANDLASAGLNRVNVSLDTLDPDKYRQITRGGEFNTVWEGILAAEKAGLTPIKINVVLIKGVNDDEIAGLANLTLRHPWQVRFIEMMPVGGLDAEGCGTGAAYGGFFSAEEAMQKIAGLHPIEEQNTHSNGPAKMYRIEGAVGSIGFITPLSDHFCTSCNRLRLTADGKLRPCLLTDIEIPVREALRSHKPIDEFFQQALVLKPAQHHLESSQKPTLRKMAQIGG